MYTLISGILFPKSLLHLFCLDIMAFVGLNSLTVGPGSPPIRVRVCRAWDVVNSRGKDLLNRGNDLLSRDMVIADEESSIMFAQVRRTLVSRFRPLLAVGSVYIITGYNVAEVSGGYRPVDWPLKLVFTVVTSVQVVNTPVPSIPLHGFLFPDLSTIMSRVNDTTCLTDIAGCLVSVDAVQPVAGGFLKRELHLKSDICDSFSVTLWSDKAERFITEYNITGTASPLILVFTSMNAKQYMDSLNYSTTGATLIYVNPDHEHVARLALLFAGTVPTVNLTTPLPNLQESVEEAMLANRMTISEVLSGSWSKEKPGYKITFAGTISSVSTKHGWYYYGCRQCKCKVAVTEGAYTCNTCKKDYTGPLILFKVLCDIEDDTGTLSCIFLNKVAERMIDSSAMKLFNRLNPNEPSFPRELLELCGQSHIFRVRLTEYNILSGGEVFSVCDVFPPAVHAQINGAVGSNAKGPTSSGASSVSASKVPVVDHKGKGKQGSGDGSGEVVSVTPPKQPPLKRKFVSDESDTETT